MTQFIKAKAYKGQPIKHIERKLDGHRIKILPGRVLTRTAGVDLWDKVATLPQYEHLFRNLPNGIEIDAELWAEGRQATEMKTLINEQSEEIRLTAFALPSHQDLNYPDMRESILALGFEVPVIVANFPMPVTLEDEYLRQLKDRAIDQEWEGYIAKLDHCEGWYKIKPTRECDAFCSWVETSTSMTYFGQVKGIELSVYDDDGVSRVICQTGNGLPARFKEEFAGDNKRKLINRVFTVEYDSLAQQGKLKFPRIVTDQDGWPIMREDKTPQECKDDQL